MGVAAALQTPASLCGLSPCNPHGIPSLTASFASPLPGLVLPLWEAPKENLVVLKLASLE